ncbi:unnamed protein product [Thlaspi arvense]|uniref:Uncharacterized protein n=1 Tax=Thlaspi arvense TaxID=13288 RepID=A0AAU9RY82_THLAR|nr:unnamed protein product [Thlaspi arvense]
MNICETNNVWPAAHDTMYRNNSSPLDCNSLSRLPKSITLLEARLIYHRGIATSISKYIQRTLEEDFKEVVGPPYVADSCPSSCWWMFTWHVYLWVSYVPLLLVLVLGTKLEVVVARMAIQVNNQNSVIVGTPGFNPRRPLLVWTAQIRSEDSTFDPFCNAFELAFFIWVTIQFGLGSCYHEHTVIIVTRVVLAVIVQVICSYITLPLYALVTQVMIHHNSSVLWLMGLRVAAF